MLPVKILESSLPSYSLMLSLGYRDRVPLRARNFVTLPKKIFFFRKEGDFT